MQNEHPSAAKEKSPLLSDAKRTSIRCKRKKVRCCPLQNKHPSAAKEKSPLCSRDILPLLVALVARKNFRARIMRARVRKTILKADETNMKMFETCR
jgi:hypothetical protein